MSMTWGSAAGIGAGVGLLGGALSSQNEAGGSRSFLYGPQEQYLQDIYGQAQNIYNQQAQQGYMSEMEKQGLAMGQQLYGQQAKYAQQLAPSLLQAQQMAQKDYDFSLNYGNINQQMGYQQQMADDLIAANTQNIYDQLYGDQLTQARLEGVSSGGTASSRSAIQQGIMKAEAADTAADQAARVQAASYQTALGQEQQRVMQDYQAQQAQMQQLAGFGQAGLQYGQQASSGMTQLGAYEFNAPTRSLQAYQQAIGQPIVLNETYGPTTNPWASGVGGLLSGAGTASSAFGTYKKYKG